MKILFVNPPRYNGLPVIREDRCEIVNRYLVTPPYSLIQIASVLREHNQEVYLIDANCEDLPHYKIREEMERSYPDIVVFRFTPTTFKTDMVTARIAKFLNPKITTVGLCWTLRSYAENILKNNIDLDAYLIGEYGNYEVTFLNLVRALSGKGNLNGVKGVVFRKGENIISTEPCTEEFNGELPLPAYDLLPPLSKYYISPKHSRHSPFTIIYTSKGCPYNCIFCVVRNTKWRERSVRSIMKEVTYLKDEHDLKCVFFMDELFTMNRQRTVDLCRELMDKKVDLTWYCSTRVDRVDRNLLELMRNAGCEAISFGIESGSQKILDYARKKVKVKQAKVAIKIVKDAGIKTHLSFIIGLPGENWSTFRETIGFVKETLPTMAQFNVAVPYPGTKLYELAVEKGWIEKELDLTQLCHQKATMRTDAMTTEDLEKARKMAYKLLYFNSAWIFENIKWILKRPNDFLLIIRHYAKSLNNYLVHEMEHAH
jgi:radical SAM superfamily enzyme YgiQ (UPF0313 family)